MPVKTARLLPSLVTAKLAVYETMRKQGWSKLKAAKQLGMPENSIRRLLDLRHSSHMWIIDEALAKMGAEGQSISPRRARGGRRRRADGPKHQGWSDTARAALQSGTRRLRSAWRS